MKLVKEIHTVLLKRSLVSIPDRVVASDWDHSGSLYTISFVCVRILQSDVPGIVIREGGREGRHRERERESERARERGGTGDVRVN